MLSQIESTETNKDSIELVNLDGELVVDSRLIAERLGIQHETVTKNLRKYAARFQAMGVFRFEIGKLEPGATGRPQEFIYLNELQSVFLMTLSKNTEAVVECKFNLTVAFEKAKKLLKPATPVVSDRIQELQLENDNLRLYNESINSRSSIVTIHGTELGLTLLGKDCQIVKVKEVSTEIVNPATGRCDNVLTADQFKSEVQRKTGQKPKSLKAFIDKLKAEGRDDLTIAVTRHSTCEYVVADKLDEAIGVVYGNARQLPVVAVGSLVVKG